MAYSKPKANLNDYNLYIATCDELGSAPKDPTKHYESHHVITKADTSVTPKGAMVAKKNRRELLVADHITVHTLWSDLFPESYAMAWAPLGMLYTRLNTEHYSSHLKGLEDELAENPYLVDAETLVKILEMFERYLEIVNVSYKRGKTWQPENDCRFPRTPQDYGSKSKGLKDAVDAYYLQICDDLGRTPHWAARESSPGTEINLNF